MALTPGTRLGPYAITEQIGVGGMGEVYQATDTNLKRQVAIKVLPESVAGDTERLARFQREAEVLAALNHPNIAQIHGLEKSDGTIALVMELVEGPTLADRIAQGAIPVDEALPIAKQIAEALEAAHEQGIIHRDLKPANVKVRPDGTVKVLDFGLAKAMQPTGAMSPSMSQPPTITTPAMTQAGMILGTAAYMSPEQARGKPVDKRADIWAFGVVLYEMLTGKRAFPGEDVSEVMASVLAREPDWTRLPRNVSPVLATYVRRCLRRDLKQRIHDIADVRLALEGAFETATTPGANVAAIQPVWRRTLPIALAVMVTAFIAGAVAWSLWPGIEPGSVNQFAYTVPEGQRVQGADRPVMAFSPDGRSFVYSTRDALYLRSMSELEARLIPGSEEELPQQGLTGQGSTSGLFYPFYSPDGQSVAYYANRELKRIAISGGPSAVIAGDLQNLDGATWGPDDTIWFGQNEGLYRVLATGGTPELMIPIEDGTRIDSPQLLPDGGAVLFTLRTTGTWDNAQVVVQSLRSGERTVVLEGGRDARYVPTGHLVYALGDRLFGIAFDVDSLSVTSAAVPLVQGLQRALLTAGANYGVSVDGTLAYISGERVSNRSDTGLGVLVWVDRVGRREAIDAPVGNYRTPRVSPDGTRIVMTYGVGDEEGISVYDLARGTLTRMPDDSDVTYIGDPTPIWSPDGLQIAYFARGETGGVGIFVRRADGIGVAERLSTGLHRAVSWSPDGARLTSTYPGGAGETRDVGVVGMTEGATGQPLLASPTANEGSPFVSRRTASGLRMSQTRLESTRCLSGRFRMWRMGALASQLMAASTPYGRPTDRRSTIGGGIPS